MSYIDEIFERVDMQHIREFLLHGTEECNISKKSYYERLITAQKKATSYLHSFYDDNDKYEEATTPVFNFVSVTEEVYMEIGLQCGILLGMQLISNTNCPPDSER